MQDVDWKYLEDKASGLQTPSQLLALHTETLDDDQDLERKGRQL
jgi:hypothetical protein